jgi:succinate-semialdehyde dehydrogenase/glutarate-semialdehyde dehydrogenase
MQAAPLPGIVESVNPATGERLAQWPLLDDAGIERAIALAHDGFLRWSRTPVRERAKVMQAIGQALRRERAALARLITLEMGKPITEAEAEVDKSAWACEHVADVGEEWLADQVVSTTAQRSYIALRPLGTVLSIFPWNFPAWQVFRCAASALMSGNTMLMKHSPNTQGSAAAIEKLVAGCGGPPGLLVNLNAPVSRIGSVIADSRIAAVTLTGSPAAGMKVASQAGAACKKSVLELGGSDAFIVLADADLDAAVAAGVRARFSNCGQVCLAAKRFLLESPIAEEFSHRFVAATAALRIGDPLDRSTQIGPLAREDLRTQLQQQVAQSTAAGARILTGGTQRPGAGWYYTPTVLGHIDRAMPVYAQETFGPAAAMLTVSGADEAVRIANDSPFGLSTMLWTRDLARAARLARELQVGSVFVNAVTASDPRMPVGGVKLSGYGRELGKTGLHELCNVQTVWIA